MAKQTASPGPPSNFRIFINEDNDHYFKLDSNLMNEQHLRDYIDRYAMIGIDTISFCTSGQRCSFRSRVLDAVWDPLPDGVKPDYSAWTMNTESLFKAGIDPYLIWLDQCRRRGIHAWISTRMNDMHHTHPSLRFRADRRWASHPQWMRGPFRGVLSPDREWDYYQKLQPDMAWNYAHPEVRALMLELLKENTEHYDAETFELDFSRTFFCLTPGHAGEDSHFLTEMLRDYKKHLIQMERRRGHIIKVAVRLPWTPQIAASWGFDVRQWAEEKLADIIVASPFCASFQYDFPLSEWRDAVGDDIDVIPAVDQWISPSPGLPPRNTTAEFLRGWCGVMAAQGASAVYLFNFPYFVQEDCLGPEAEKFRDMADFGMNRILESDGPRCTQAGYLDFPAEGESCRSVFPNRLDGNTVVVTLPFGNVPEGGRVTVRPEIDSPISPGGLEIRLNGQLADADGVVDAAVLRTGANEITLRGDSCVIANLYLTWSPFRR